MGDFAENHWTKKEYLKKVRLKSNFIISLPQAMIVAMEDEARWRIKNSSAEKNKGSQLSELDLCKEIKISEA